jgi:transposase, IS30 family
MAVFSDRMVPEKVQAFWAALQAGEFITAAAARAGTYRVKGRRWIVAAGGVRPRRGRHLVGRYLSFGEREEIALGRARGESLRTIAARLGRAPSTVSRELRRNSDGGNGYRATSAHALAYQRAARPKPAKLATNAVLRGIVEQQLHKRYSPEQIAGRLRRQYPDNPEMWVSAETIYQSLYVQSRGALQRELTRCLRTGRALRHPGRKPGQRKKPHPRHGQHQSAPRRSRRPGNARALGGRLADRSVQPDRDWHPGRTRHRIHHAAAPAQRLWPRASPRRSGRPKSRLCRQCCAAR